MRIPIVTRITQERAAAAQQGKVHSPGVHADAVHAAEIGCAFSHGGEHLVVKVQHIPMDGVEGGCRSIWKTVYVLQAEALAIEGAKHSSAAFRAEIESQDLLGSGHRLDSFLTPSLRYRRRRNCGWKCTAESM